MPKGAVGKIRKPKPKVPHAKQVKKAKNPKGLTVHSVLRVGGK